MYRSGSPGWRWAVRLSCALAMLVLPLAARAQGEIGRRLSTPVRFSGEIGSRGELYSISGREQRRPSSSARLYLRSSLQLFSTVSVGLDLQYSTESGSSAGVGSSRQPFNQIGITPEWQWGRAYAGSFSDSYSSLTWSGVRMRGAGFNINPGPLRLAAFHGRSQSAVVGGVLDGAYRRSMSGGRIGFGRRSDTGDGRFIDVVLLRAADDPSSLPIPEADATPSVPTDNAFAVTPQENIVLATVTRVPLWQGLIVVSGEAAASIHSRDRRAPVLTDDALDEYAGLLRTFITPRASTYGDIAHNGKVELRNLALPGSSNQSRRTLSASLGYRYVGAGYVSLGLASLPADQQAITADVGVRFPKWNASLRAMQQHDNLLGQKLATTERYRIAGSAMFRPSRTLNSALRIGVNTVDNDSDDVTRRVDFTSWLIGTTQTISLGRDRRLRALAFSWGYQQAGDAGEARADRRLRAHDTSVRATFEASSRVTLTPAVGVALSSTGGTDWKARHTYSLAGHYRGGGRWSSSASLSNSRLNSGGSIQGSLSTRVQLTSSDLVTVSLRSNRVSGIETVSGRFHENRVNVNWSRRIQ